MGKNRIYSLEIVRGIALMFIIFFHSSIYNFANIHKIDFSNPPIMIVLMSFMALWGGIFIVYSMIVNSFMIAKRSEEGVTSKQFAYISLSVLFYLIIHYVLTVFLGRWNVDFVNNTPNLTFIAEAFRHKHIAMPNADHLFEGSSISTIALNLFISSWILYFVLKAKIGWRKIYFSLTTAGFAVIVLSFFRVGLFKYFTSSISGNNYFLSIIYSFVLANPYPMITYFSYGLFGALLGLLIYNERRDIMKRVVLPVSGFIFVYGILGMMNFDKTISKPDYFWYFKTNFELGFFLFSNTIIYLIFEDRKKLLSKLSVLKNFSRISLTIYLLEVTLSEIFRIIITPIIPSWNQTINGSLLFGLFNVCVWILIVTLWSRAGFKYSFEYFWVKMFEKIGKTSTKLTRD